ncbi:AraC family transcriptional regulator [Brachybacterium sp. GCM10030267]|uniref:AraC family transcriptional regulator n=1 Tax=Brachybacterium sp. GCM10030267 TaxID=3273381 RepID=UPI0036178BDD
MDTLSEVLDNIRSSGALIDQNLLEAPWSIRFEAGSSITVATPLQGQAWLIEDGVEPVGLAARDLLILTGPDPVLITSDPLDRTAAPSCIVRADGSCLEPAGRLDGIKGLDRRRAAPAREHVLLTGTFPTSGRISERLLGALPPAVVLPRRHQRSRALDMLEAELGSREPGQQAVLDRLLDLVLIGALRDWFALPEASAPAWYGAAGDPVVGPALAALHTDPARPWTVESLARAARVSRATLARRFADVMGEPPISYLAGWRLCLAADLLQDTEDTIETVARRVGYSSPYALSAAFTREYGIRPSQYRAQSRRAAA